VSEPGAHWHWLGAFGTALVAVAYVPQVRHLTTSRCGDGLSLGAYAMWTSAAVLLCFYAITRREPVFVALQGYHAAACGLILVLGLRYRTARCAMHGAGETPRPADESAALPTCGDVTSPRARRSAR
jgi:uncharacterized protein with PQ loop repeat